MVKFKTTKEFELFDKRNNSLGSFVLHLIITSIYIDISGVKPTGIYYYINSDNEEIPLDTVKTGFNWDLVEQAESQLPTLEDTRHLKECVLQRMTEFNAIQQQIENGSNWGSTSSDWVRDTDYDNRLNRR